MCYLSPLDYEDLCHVETKETVEKPKGEEEVASDTVKARVFLECHE